MAVLDSFQFFGPANVAATVSFEVRWEATGGREVRGGGTAVPPTDPAAFLGHFAPALSTASFSGFELGFSFRSDPGASSERGYAQFGPERNGVFLT